MQTPSEWAWREWSRPAIALKAKARSRRVEAFLQTLLQAVPDDPIQFPRHPLLRADLFRQIVILDRREGIGDCVAPKAR